MTGYRGGGKTMFMTYLAILAMVLQDVRCWANYKISVLDKGKIWAAEPLDIKRLWTLDPTLKGGIVAIDEINVFVNAARHMSNNNLIFSMALQQIRKRHLHLLYTSQSFGWTDSTVRFATDVEIVCSELAYTPWGHEHKLDEGKVFSLRLRELSGRLTGRSWFDDGQETLLTFSGGKLIGNFYDSDDVVDVFGGMLKIEFVKPRLRIKIGEAAQAAEARTVEEELEQQPAWVR